MKCMDDSVTESRWSHTKWNLQTDCSHGGTCAYITLLVLMGVTLTERCLQQTGSCLFCSTQCEKFRCSEKISRHSRLFSRSWSMSLWGLFQSSHQRRVERFESRCVRVWDDPWTEAFSTPASKRKDNKETTSLLDRHLKDKLKFSRSNRRSQQMTGEM